jgi:hypothetical protein
VIPPEAELIEVAGAPREPELPPRETARALKLYRALDEGISSASFFYGPFTLPGGPWLPRNIPVLIGKISTPPS